jgi:hypothetical protein
LQNASLGPVDVQDLLYAIGPQYDHFNWYQTYEYHSSKALSKLIINPTTGAIVSQFSDPHVDPWTDNSVRLAYIKDLGTPQERGMKIGIPGFELAGEAPDVAPYYFNEGGTELQTVTKNSGAVLEFEDAPRIDGTFYDAGDYISFRTELYAVSSTGTVPGIPLGIGYTWKSDARWAGSGGPGVLGTGYLKVTGDVSVPPVIAGGIYDLETFGSTFLSGDYNSDGVVDAVDYVVWRKTDGSQGGYNLWRDNFGRTTSSGSGSSTGAPEPSTFTLLCLILCSAVNRRRR